MAAPVRSKRGIYRSFAGGQVKTENRFGVSAAPLRHRKDHRDAGVRSATGCVDPQWVPIPSFNLTIDRGVPIQQGETRRIAFPGFHGAPVLFDIRADRLDLTDSGAGPRGDAPPSD